MRVLFTCLICLDFCCFSPSFVVFFVFFFKWLTNIFRFLFPFFSVGKGSRMWSRNIQHIFFINYCFVVTFFFSTFATTLLKLNPFSLLNSLVNGKAIWSKKLFTYSSPMAKDQFNFIVFESGKKHANAITQQKLLEKCKVNQIILK